MAQILTERVADLGQFRAMKAAGIKLPLWPLELAHIYVMLDFKPEFEHAATADHAKGFLSSVARASMAADQIAQRYNGLLLEVQGSVLHIGLQQRYDKQLLDSARAFASELHWVYRRLFPDQQKRVQGWRMTIDAGKTLVVAGRGVHGDDSYVSLGKAANRPAKHLYAQLELPEAERQLNRFYVGYRTLPTGRWLHENLDNTTQRLEEAVEKIVANARTAEPKLDFSETVGGWKQVTARARPIGTPGSPTSPTPDKPHTYFGWILRSDLDGFTARVEACFDNDVELRKLAEQFYCLMDSAAQFVERHKLELLQLPWAGDNFTAAAVFSEKAEYDAAIPKRLVELTLDYDKNMVSAAVECGFGGWANAVAGGDPNGNAAGNVFLAGVEVDGRRFLVAVGEGVGRSVQAFGDIDPKAKDLVLYEPDWKRLHDSYRAAFEPAVKPKSGVRSTLYRKANVDALRKVQAREAAATSSTIIEFPGEPKLVIPTRHHYR